MTAICILVGSMAISGGTYVIVQHASYLHDHGFSVTLAVQEPFTDETLRWHDGIKNIRCIAYSVAQQETFDLVIATWWKTALTLTDFDAPRYAYFVQSIESKFYAEEEVPLRRLVDSTYELPVNFVTEVSWIKDHLFNGYSQHAAIVRNGVRKDLYYPKEKKIVDVYKGQDLRVLVEGPFRVKFKNVGKTIQLVKKAGVRDITLLTSSPVNWIPQVQNLYSRVPITAVPNIYQSCDVLVKLSTVEGMFGPPLEMFHCGGTAIVYNVSGFDEYIEHEHNALVATMGDENAVVEHIQRLMRDKELLDHLKQNARLTADSWPSWTESSVQFHDWITCVLMQPYSDKEKITAHIADVWREYIATENERLQHLPKSVLKNKLYSLIRMLPPSAKKLLEQWIAIYETIC